MEIDRNAESHRAIVQDLRNKVEATGWAFVGVSAAPKPSFVYTVELTKLGFSDLYISGLEVGLPTLANIVNNVVDFWKEAGGVRLGTVTGILNNDVPVLLRAVDPDEASLRMAMAKFFGPVTKVVQILLPDANGHFPGSDQYDQSFEQIVFTPIQ